jgi:hypothetical protein
MLHIRSGPSVVGVGVSLTSCSPSSSSLSPLSHRCHGCRLVLVLVTGIPSSLSQSSSATCRRPCPCPHPCLVGVLSFVPVLMFLSSCRRCPPRCPLPGPGPGPRLCIFIGPSVHAAGSCSWLQLGSAAVVWWCCCRSIPGHFIVAPHVGSDSRRQLRLLSSPGPLV